ncbi:uncharacterized protein LOC122052864 [Zingiber officinale]|uniref:uncharacterized protein LOC122052864 n=1 Tax=Zingiber officinale TaxID=94328 RepID=UPI001C4DCB39|nr:uncharacterized protein LOC122052864 [Zingiber officinale]
MATATATASLSSSVFSSPKSLLPTTASSLFPRAPRFRLVLQCPPLRGVFSSSTAVAPAAADDFRLRFSAASTAEASTSLSKWVDFAQRVSGEWDGFGADFTSEGVPVELPENVVPDAFREWDVQVFDWQTQCPTLADEKGFFLLTYKMIRLLPTVGCEADAATRYSVEERIVGGPDNQTSAFAFDSSGSFVAVWALDGLGGQKIIELEHCLVDPRDKEVRMRVIQVVRVEEGAMRLEKIKVFSEHWDGPFRNGELMGGCAIGETAFAASVKVDVSEVVGVWHGITASIARFQSEQREAFHELVVDAPTESVRDHRGLVALPKNLWSLSESSKDGEAYWEVGWLLDHGEAITSRCVFLDNRIIKEINIARQIAESKKK